MTPEVRMIPVTDLISEDATRLSRDEAYIQALADDFTRRLKERPDVHPVHTAVRVYARGGKFVILAGTNRWLAAPRAGLTTLPCRVEAAPSDAVREFEEQVRDNELRAEPTPADRASNVLKLMAMSGCGQGEAASRLGMGASNASKAKKVLEGYPADLQPLVGDGDGRVPFTCAYILAASRLDEGQVRELTDRVVKGLLSRDALQERVNALVGKRAKAAKPVKVALPGLTLVTSLTDAAVLRATLGRLLDALAKAEKHALPMTSLPQLVKG